MLEAAERASSSESSVSSDPGGRMEVCDPRWLDVEAGRRHTTATAIKLFPQLNTHSFKDLAFKMARKRKHCKGIREVKTFAATDVDALVAHLAAPEPIDPRWLEVESGLRYTATTALERYPHLRSDSFKDLPFHIVRRPKTDTNMCHRNVRSYLAADVDALAAERAKKRPRRSPSEPRPEPEQDGADGDDGECIIYARVGAWV